MAELVSMSSTAASSLGGSIDSLSAGRSNHRRRRDDSWGESFEASSSELFESTSSVDIQAVGGHRLEIGDLRALVVEDDPLNLMGVEAILSGSYSLVITDMHMPVMSGVDMIRTMAARSAENAAARAALDRAYVVILSGSLLSASDVEDMAAAGVGDTLQKPVLRS